MSSSLMMSIIRHDTSLNGWRIMTCNKLKQFFLKYLVEKNDR